MTKQCVFWRPIILKTVRGRDFVSHTADLIASHYRGSLIAEIQKMQRKQSITFEEAVGLIHDEQLKARSNAKKYLSYYENFIQYVSDLGFHIELTGDEFEVVLRQTETC